MMSSLTWVRRRFCVELLVGKQPQESLETEVVVRFAALHTLAMVPRYKCLRQTTDRHTFVSLGENLRASMKSEVAYLVDERTMCVHRCVFCLSRKLVVKDENSRNLNGWLVGNGMEGKDTSKIRL